MSLPNQHKGSTRKARNPASKQSSTQKEKDKRHKNSRRITRRCIAKLRLRATTTAQLRESFMA